MRCVARNIGETKRENSLRSSQPRRTYSSTMHSAIVSTWPASPGRTIPTRSIGSSCSRFLYGIAFGASWSRGILGRLRESQSALHPNRLAAQVAVHEVLLVSRGEAGARRLPGALSVQTTCLGFGDPDQRLLGDGVESV